jgi:hypothetical protein
LRNNLFKLKKVSLNFIIFNSEVKLKGSKMKLFGFLIALATIASKLIKNLHTKTLNNLNFNL